MMKTKRRVRTRLCSLMLAACMLVSLLPLSAIVALGRGGGACFDRVAAPGADEGRRAPGGLDRFPGA